LHERGVESGDEATVRLGEKCAESKRLPREDREVFKVTIDVRCFVGLREQEALTDPDFFQLEAFALFGVFDS
jgi:hypothetical protein